MRRIIKNTLLILCITLVSYAIACFGMEMYSRYVNSKEYVIKMNTVDEDYRFECSKSKLWEETAIVYKYGMQIDFEIENFTNWAMNNWYAEIEVIDNCRIDSSWNGDFELDDNNIITVTPVEYNDTVDAKEMQPFGMILYGPERLCIKDAKIIYHVHRRIYDFAMFYIITFLMIVSIVVSIVYTIFAIKNEQLRHRQEVSIKIINQSYIAFANMIDAKDSYTKGHSQRVACYARELAKRMGFDKDKQTNIFYVALLHDIGKIGVQDAILKKTAKLTLDEFNEIKEHVSMGGDILKNFTAIEGIEDGVRYHHEKYDGTGYMAGLKGEEIPLIARIICVADAFDAMSSARCYRENPLTKEKIIDELTKYSGTQFDPKIVPYMLDMIDDGVAPIELKDDGLLEKELAEIENVK